MTATSARGGKYYLTTRGRVPSLSILVTPTSGTPDAILKFYLTSPSCRIMQNRKSAKKCRLKKKAEFGQMRGDVMKLYEENKSLKEKVSTTRWY